jgi:hypothetical protein
VKSLIAEMSEASMGAVKILEVFEKLAPQDQCEVLDFADFLLRRVSEQPESRAATASDPVLAIQNLLGDIPAECSLADELIAERRRVAADE